MKSDNGKTWSLWQSQLARDYDHINWTFKLNLHRPQIRIVSVCSYWGQWDPLHREIKISENLIKNFPWIIVIQILKHEMAHQIVSDQIKVEDGHGPFFQQACEKLALDRRFRAAQAQLKFDSKTLCSMKYSQVDASISLAQEEDPHQKLLERVEKLLALADSSCENEALLAMERITELFEKHNLSFQSIADRRPSFSLLQIDLGTQKVSAVHSLISSILTENFFVEIILNQTYNAKRQIPSKTLDILGTKENLALAEYVYYFLVQKIDSLWITYRQVHNLSHHHKRSYQIGVLHGFRNQLGSLLRNRRKQKGSGINEKALIFEPTADPQFKKYLRQNYPRLRLKSSNQGRVFSDSFSAGKSEGHKIRLNKPIESPVVGQGGLLGFSRW